MEKCFKPLQPHKDTRSHKVHKPDAHNHQEKDHKHGKMASPKSQHKKHHHHGRHHHQYQHESHQSDEINNHDTHSTVEDSSSHHHHHDHHHHLCDSDKTHRSHPDHYHHQQKHHHVADRICHSPVSGTSSSSSDGSSSSSSSSSSASSSSSYSSSTSTSASSSTLSSESESCDRYPLRKSQHSQSCTDISRRQRAFEEGDDMAPLIDDEGHLNTFSAKEKQARGKCSHSGPVKDTSKSQQRITKGLGKDGSFRKAKSMEALSRPEERKAHENEDEEEIERRKTEARKNLVKEKLKFSAFLNEITRQVLSPLRLTSLGVTDVHRPCSPGQASVRSLKTDSRIGNYREQRSRSGSADSVSSSNCSHISMHSQLSKHSHSSRRSHSKFDQCTQHHHSHHHSAEDPPHRMHHSPRSCSDVRTSPETSYSQRRRSRSLTSQPHSHSPTYKHHHHHHQGEHHASKHHHHHRDNNSHHHHHGHHHSSTRHHDNHPTCHHGDPCSTTHHQGDHHGPAHHHGDHHSTTHRHHHGDHDSPSHHHGEHHSTIHRHHHGDHDSPSHHHGDHHDKTHHYHYRDIHSPTGHHEDHSISDSHHHHHGDHSISDSHHYQHGHQHSLRHHQGDHHSPAYHRGDQHSNLHHHSNHPNKTQYSDHEDHSTTPHHLGRHSPTNHHGDHHNKNHQHHHGSHHSMAHHHHHGDAHSPTQHHHHGDHSSPAHQHHHGDHHSTTHHHNHGDHSHPAHQHHHGDHHSTTHHHHHHHEDHLSSVHHHHHGDHHSTSHHQGDGSEPHHKPSHSKNNDPESHSPVNSDVQHHPSHSDSLQHHISHHHPPPPSDSEHSPTHSESHYRHHSSHQLSNHRHYPTHEEPHHHHRHGETHHFHHHDDHSNHLKGHSPVSLPTSSPSSQDEEQTGYTGSSLHKDKAQELGRIMMLQEQNEGLHHSLMKTAVRMECLGDEFMSSQKLLEAELQRTRVELGNLMERFKRLHDSCSSTQQTNNLLEQKLHSVAQNMEEERESLNQRISALTEQLAKAKFATSMEPLNVTSVLHQTVDHHYQSDDAINQFVLPIAPPPPQFMDGLNYGKVTSPGQEQCLGSVPEEEESDWSEVGDETPRFILTGTNRAHAKTVTFSTWRHGEREGDIDSESGGEEVVRRNPPLQIPHLQFTVHSEILPVPLTNSFPAGFKNLSDSIIGEGGYRVTASQKLSSPILIRSASLEEIPRARHRMQEELRGTEAMMDLHHPEDDATEDSDSEIIRHWRAGNDSNAATGRPPENKSSEPDRSLAGLQSAQRMLNHFICELQPSEGSGQDRVGVQGWTGGLPDEVLKGERTAL